MSGSNTLVAFKTQYLRLAEQCERRARSAKTEAELREYRTRAALWQRLADGRLETSGLQRNFVGLRRRRSSDANPAMRKPGQFQRETPLHLEGDGTSRPRSKKTN